MLVSIMWFFYAVWVIHASCLRSSQNAACLSWELEGIFCLLILCLHFGLFVCKWHARWLAVSAPTLERCQAESALQRDNRHFFFLISGLLQGMKSFRYFCGLEGELRVNAIVGWKGRSAGALLLLMQGSTSLVNRVALLLKVLITTLGQCSSTLWFIFSFFFPLLNREHLFM